MDDKEFRKQVESFVMGGSTAHSAAQVSDSLRALAGKAKAEQESFRSMGQLRQQLNEQLARLGSEMLRSEGRASVLMDLVAEGLVSEGVLPELSKSKKSLQPSKEEAAHPRDTPANPV